MYIIVHGKYDATTCKIEILIQCEHDIAARNGVIWWTTTMAVYIYSPLNYSTCIILYYKGRAMKHKWEYTHRHWTGVGDGW